MRPASLLPRTSLGSLLLLGLLAGPAGAQRQAELPSPFQRLEDTGDHGYVKASFDAHDYAPFALLHEDGALATVTGFPLPDGREVELLLQPLRVWEEGGTARVMTDGEEQRLAPSVRMFRAHVPGHQSRGFLGITPTMLHGFLSLDGEQYLLSTGPGGQDLAIANSAIFEGAPAHPDHDHASAGVEALLGERDEERPVELRSVPRPKLRSVEMFVDCDYRIRAAFASDQDMIDYATLLTGAINVFNRRDIGLEILIPDGYLRIWNDVDPWEGTPGGWERWFNTDSNPVNGIERGLAHKLSAWPRPSSARGPHVCKDDRSFAYTGIRGFFPYPLTHTSSDNFDLYVYGQETGHVLGSGHTFTYHPEILCSDGSGPDAGTIMSYCQVSQIGMRFHERVQDTFLAFLKTRFCYDERIPRRGDFDGSGVIDLADVAEFDAYRLQGFASRYAERVFDINIDGVVDDLDRALLVGRVVEPATTELFNGGGVNCLCYGAVTQPILGETWTTLVGNSLSSSVLTAVFGAPARLDPPVVLGSGELLIALTGFGGATLFTSYETTVGSMAEHSHELPMEPSWAGLTFHTQAVLFEPTGLRLTNGLSLRFSTY